MGRDRDMLPQAKPGSRPPTNQPCSYNLGYTRQDVYACNKCSRVDGAGRSILSGFCVGCKTTCHADHLDSVTDLYSKRYFRCDCGNGRMGNICMLQPIKTENVDNARTYNHNFVGKYCRCDRGYDPRYGDMLQCAMCEDWFHEICLFMPDGIAPVLGRSRLANITCELVCTSCAKTTPLLADYYASLGLFQPAELMRMPNGQSRAPPCLRPPSSRVELLGKDLLFPAGFRLRLCRCDLCKAQYARLKVEYLIDRKDFVNLAGIDEVDLLVNAPAPADVLRKAVKGGARKEKRALDVDADMDENDDDFDVAATVSSKRGRKQVKTSVPVVQLSEEEREHIRSSVTSFVNRALGSEKTPNEKELKDYLRKLRTDILQAHK